MNVQIIGILLAQVTRKFRFPVKCGGGDAGVMLLNDVSSDKGFLHKSLVLEGEVHTVEEIQLLKNSEPIKTLLLSSQAVRTAQIHLISHVAI